MLYLSDKCIHLKILAINSPQLSTGWSTDSFKPQVEDQLKAKQELVWMNSLSCLSTLVFFNRCWFLEIQCWFHSMSIFLNVDSMYCTSWPDTFTKPFNFILLELPTSHTHLGPCGFNYLIPATTWQTDNPITITVLPRIFCSVFVWSWWFSMGFCDASKHVALSIVLLASWLVQTSNELTRSGIKNFITSFKIVLSLFVAVILDNLELDEDVKKIKQVCW